MSNPCLILVTRIGRSKDHLPVANREGVILLRLGKDPHRGLRRRWRGTTAPALVAHMMDAGGVGSAIMVAGISPLSVPGTRIGPRRLVAVAHLVGHVVGRRGRVGGAAVALATRAIVKGGRRGRRVEGAVFGRRITLPLLLLVAAAVVVVVVTEGVHGRWVRGISLLVHSPSTI